MSDTKHIQDVLEHGEDICSRCGKEDYFTNFEDVDGKPVCEDCLADETATQTA